MRVRVLGAAAGGGYPQWNCGCDNCVLARKKDPRTKPRTQDSVAVTASGANGAWAVLNASPDIHAQIARAQGLHPRGPRDSPIAAIVLTNGDLDHILGLFSLRESQPLNVFATEAVWAGLAEGNAIFKTLRRFEGQVTWKRLELGKEMDLVPSLSIRAFAVPGKLPVHLMGGARAASPEDNIGVVIREADSRVVYCASQS
jgi:pyrroloquinoline quinone biosynthesis protein B